ncbi:hybrid sensor histidine kinase/response regulator [Alsobacter soli]|uniref:histidine kinase n=1 Tax=Alsobacter soli TaxID=2109933 RepID=A0A2T1HQC3_9HYPH|nr:response regulator [Alsobacter soli]PSC03858.1 hybrid sensor histidine kinase/response regulator [Alsobacter soli]
MSLHETFQKAPGAILVVDDEPDILIALEDLLGDDYEVITSASPSEALELLRARPDIMVIVSDERMPGMMGHDFLAEARRLSEAEAILLTGYADLPAVVGALNRGGITGYAPKPWDPAALRGMVAGAMERRRLKLELQTERALLRGLLDNVADAIAFKDASGRFVRMNARKAEQLGADMHACLGRLEADFVDPDRAAAVQDAEREAIARKATTDVVEEHASEDGPRWRQVIRTPIFGPSGALESLAVIERDITEQRRLDARLRQAEKMQALGTLAGGVAHDFNNLLTAVLGSIDLAARRIDDNPRVSKLLANAAYAARRGASLTHRLLSFSRQRELEPRVVNPNTVLAEMSELLARTLGGMVQIEKRCADDLWPVLIDPAQLELAILNLCVNARDAMPDGGTLTLSTRNARIADGDALTLPAGDYVALTVRDTGSGMAPDVAARIFEPFFTTKEIGKGTGLGLSMVYGLVQQSGGAVDVQTAPGRGTAITLYFPRSEQAGEAADEPGATPGQRKRRSGRILVVDDDRAVRSVTAQFLQELGHQVIEAESAAEALAAIDADARPDLVIADIAMPEMNGLELAAHLRSRERTAPVLLVTGYADISGREIDAAVIHKPFQIQDLDQAVTELLGKD